MFRFYEERKIEKFYKFIKLSKNSIINKELAKLSQYDYGIFEIFNLKIRCSSALHSTMPHTVKERWMWAVHNS